MEENTNKYDHLVELGGSDYEIADGEPHIIGWDVKNKQGQKIGEVDELLFDPQSRKVRYLIVDLDGNKLGLDDDKKVLAPIGVAKLHGSDVDEDENTVVDKDENTIYNADNDGDVVIVPVTAEQLNELPAYERDHVSPETESTIRRIFEGDAISGAPVYNRNDFYDHDHFDENKFYDRGATMTSIVPVIEEDLEVGKNEVETGGARITSRIVERPVEKNINLKEEHVNMERKPVNRPVTDADQPFKESEISITEHKEVPVVSKETRVVEEVSLNKEVEEKEETIRDTVRNTEVEAEKIPPHAQSNNKSGTV